MNPPIFGLFLALLAMACPAFGQVPDEPGEFGGPLSDLGLGLPVEFQGSRSQANVIALTLRTSRIFGEIDKDSSTEYDDLFRNSYGVGLDLRFYDFGGEGGKAGFYLSAAWDSYPGEEFNGFEPDNMNVFSGTAGFRAAYESQIGLIAELYGGLGAARYLESDGTLIGTGELKFIKASTVATFEAGLRMGLAFGGLLLDAGLGYRFQGDPRHGEVAFRSENLSIITISAGIGWRF